MRFKLKMAEIYQGIKFNYKSNGETISKSGLLSDLKKWCRIFHEENLAPSYPGGSSGNLSFRIKNGEIGFIITASHTALKENMSDNDFTEVISYNKSKNTITGKGKREPSSEAVMHFLIYKNRPDINTVLHGHSPDIINHADSLNIPTTEKELPYGTYEIAENALKLIKKSDFIILKNHGFISLGKTVEEAGNNIMNILTKCKSVK